MLKGNAVACSNPPALETWCGSIQYLISFKAEYQQYKGSVMTAKLTHGCAPGFSITLG